MYHEGNSKVSKISAQLLGYSQGNLIQYIMDFLFEKSEALDYINKKFPLTHMSKIPPTHINRQIHACQNKLRVRRLGTHVSDLSTRFFPVEPFSVASCPEIMNP